MKKCNKCDREIEFKKHRYFDVNFQPTEKWKPWDVEFNDWHYNYCFKGEPKFKIYDKILLFFKDACYSYTVGNITNMSYTLNRKSRSGIIKTKQWSFKYVEDLCSAKLCDKLYELLYE